MIKAPRLEARRARLAWSSSEKSSVILRKGVVIGDAVDPVLDSTGREVQREQPTVDLDTLSMGMCDHFRVAVERGTHSVRIGRAIFGHLA